MQFNGTGMAVIVAVGTGQHETRDKVLPRGVEVGSQRRFMVDTVTFTQISANGFL